MSFYLKATAIANELEQDPAFVDAGTMERIKADADASMLAADECFIKSQGGGKKMMMKKKKKKKKKEPAPQPALLAN